MNRTKMINGLNQNLLAVIVALTLVVERGRLRPQDGARGEGFGRPIPAPTATARPGSMGPVYLTFDDGPTAGYTNEVLDDLNAAHAHATFFESGKSTYTPSGMVGNASLVRRLTGERQPDRQPLVVPPALREPDEGADTERDLAGA